MFTNSNADRRLGRRRYIIASSVMSWLANIVLAITTITVMLFLAIVAIHHAVH